MALDFKALEVKFNGVIGNPASTIAEKYVVHCWAIKELQAVTAFLEQQSGAILNGAVKALAEKKA